MADFKEIQIDGQVYQVKDETARQSSGGYAPPAGGIPKNDLSSDVQTSLGKADSSLQPSDKSQLQTAINTLQGALNTLIGSGNVQGAIDTFNEVVAFLAGISSSDTLAAKLAQLATDMSNKVDKVAGKGLSTEDYTTAEKTKLAGLPTGTELESTYPTKAQMQSAIEEAAIEAVVGNGDFAMTYDQASDTFNIVRLVPTINVSDESLSFDSTAKVKTITVSGRNLKADITIQAPTGWTADKTTLAHTDGVVAETQVTLTYGGADSSTATGNLVLTAGTASVSVPLSYTQYGGPTITVEPASLSFEAIGGQTQTKTATVGKFNVTGDVSVAVTGTDASKFSASLNGNTLTVVYTPGSVNSGTHSATITLSAVEDGETISKAIAVSGSVLPQSLSVSPASLDFSGSAGTATSAKQIVLTGASLLNDVAVTVPTGFTVTRNGSAVTSIAKEDVMASGGVTLDVVAAGTNESGSLAFASGLASASVSLSWHETEVEDVGSVVTRMHGYASADATSPTIGIKFRITALPDVNTHGKVKVVNSIGKCGYYNELSSKTNYTGMYRANVPATIDINGNTYDVTELGGGCFGLSSSLNYISFEGPTNLKSFNNEKDSDAIGSSTTPFYSSPNFKGTSTAGNDNIMVYPYGVTSVSAVSGSAFKVNKMYLPDTCTSFSAAQPASHITFVDLGTGFNAFNASLVYFSAPTIFILRSSTKVTIPNTNVFNGWQGGTVIYVPSALISAYESDTNWAAGSDKITFAALEGSPYETSIYNNNN